MTLNNKSKSIFLERMSSICTDQSSITAKFAKITLFSSSTSILFDKLLLTIEYLQLLAPSLFFALSFGNGEENSLSQRILFISRISNPGWWISFENLGVFEITILCSIFFLTLLKYSLGFYVLQKLFHRKEPNQFLTKAWSYLFKLQTRVLYFYMTCCWVNVLITWPWSATDAGGISKGMVILSIIGLVLELSLSLVLSTCCSYIFPTKSFLAAKDNKIEILNLIQKVILQVLSVLLDLNSQTTTWIVFLVSLSFDFLRNIYFFKTLPLYNFQALQYQGQLLMAVSSLNLACFVLNIMKSVDDDSNSLKLFVFLWVLLFLMMSRLSRQWLKRMFWRVIFDSEIKSPGLLIHRISAIKQLRRLTIPEFQHNAKYDQNLFTNKCLDKKNLERILKLNGDSQMELDINEKKSANWMFKKYLESLANQFPKNEFIRLYLARFNVNKFRKYGDSLKVVTSLQSSERASYKLQSELVLIEIQDHIQKAVSSQDRQLNPEVFIREQSLLAQLKLKMLEQTKLHMKICQELKKENPDTEFILLHSQILNKFRQSVLSQFKHFLNNSEGNLEPILLFAHYCLSLNHSQEDYEYYTQLHTELLSRHKKYFDQEGLSQKNVFQENLGFFFISGDKADAGNIVFGSKGMGFKSVADLNMLFGTNLANRAAPCLRGIYANFYKMFAENGQTAYFDKLSRGYMFNQDGYLVEVDFYFSIHPFLTQGFYFIVIFRPVESNRDSIFIVENGDIDCATKNIGERFDLLLDSNKEKKLKNIKEICPELLVVNKAFNMIAFPEKYVEKDSLSIDQAREIYDLFTTTGKNLLLSSSLDESNVIDSREIYSYNCKMTMRIFGPLVVKILVVEENEPHKSVKPHVKKAFKNERKIHITEGSDFEAQKFISTTQTPLAKKGTFFETQTQRDQESNTFRALIETTQEADVIQEDQRRDKNMFKVYKQSLETTRYYPKSFKAFCGLIYLAILLFLILQVTLTVFVNNNTPDLKSKKDALRNFQYRNFLLISLEGALRRVRNIKAGTDHSSTSVLNNYKLIVHQLSTSLATANEELLINYRLLDDNINALLFENSIPIYFHDDDDAKTPSNFNTLQAVSQVVESSLMVISNDNLEEIEGKANFVFRNALNDLFVRNQLLSEIVKNFLDEQRGNVEDVSMKSKLALFVTLFLASGVFMGQIWKLYVKEYTNLSAVCSIHNTKIDHVLQACGAFEEVIEDFIHPISLETSSLLLKINKRKLAKVDSSKRTVTKMPNNKGRIRNYILHILKYICLVTALLGLRYLTSSFSTEITEAFQEEQGRIYFIDYMKTRVALSFQVYRELLSTNDTALIENRKASVELKIVLEELTDIRTQAYSYLLNTKTAMSNPEIRTVLLEDGCKFIDQEPSLSLCQSLKQSGKKTGIIYLLSSFQEFLGRNFQGYESSDKTAETLQDFERDIYGSFIAIFTTMIYGFTNLSDLINDHLEGVVQENIQKRNWTFGMSLLVNALLGYVMWIVILKKLRQGVNEMKNVLKVLPPNVVLSNFVLKRFLIKTMRKREMVRSHEERVFV